MGITDWFYKLFTKEEAKQPVPSYRFGDFTYDELQAVCMALDTEMHHQMEYSSGYTDVPLPMLDRCKMTALLYKEVLGAMQQYRTDDSYRRGL